MKYLISDQLNNYLFIKCEPLIGLEFRRLVLFFVCRSVLKSSVFSSYLYHSNHLFMFFIAFPTLISFGL